MSQASISKKSDTTIKLFGIPVFSASKSRLLKALRAQLASTQVSSLVTIATLNPEQVIQSDDDPSFREVLMQYDYVVADGVGISWAVGQLHDRSIDRIPGADLAAELVMETVAAGEKVFLLGGQAGVGQAAAQHLVRRFCGRHWDAQPSRIESQLAFDLGAAAIRQGETPAEAQRVLEHIAAVKPALLLVAYGAPWQEQWIAEHRHSLAVCGVRVAMVVGGTLDYWSGRTRRAPQLLQRIGLEWLWRLVMQPWRVGRQMRLVRFWWKVVGGTGGRSQ